MRTTGIWALALTTLIGSQSVSAADLPGKGIAVQPVQSTISEETFQTLLVSKALEKLGYDVKEPREVDYNVAYTSIASGDATFIAVNWDPLHADQYKAAGGGKFYREGVYVNGAAQGYLIDKKTAEQYHITNVEQLKDPKIAKLFDTNGDGKADLTGCTPGWGCEAVINHHIKAYGLSNTVEHNQGNYAAMIADTITRYKEGKPVLYYTWTPYWVSDVMVPGATWSGCRCHSPPCRASRRTSTPRCLTAPTTASRSTQCASPPTSSGPKPIRRPPSCSPS